MWMQASRALPCPVCGSMHYCSLKPNAGIVKCTKVSDGAFSQKKDAAGFAFYHKHDFGDTVFVDTTVQEAKPVPSWASVSSMASSAPRRHLRPLARLMGCEVKQLQEWGVGYLTSQQLLDTGTICHDHGAFTFPMRDAGGRPVGFRLRTPSGFKYAIKGSQNGLFWHTGDLKPNQPVLVVDGASDALVGHLAGLNVVGRPSSTTGNKELLKLFERLKPRYVDQLLDQDSNQNRELARDTAHELISNIHHGSIFYPPRGKDLREWLHETDSLPNRLSRLVAICGSTEQPSPE